ncbi:helix-turn-helix domain-containing protein [Cereibacter azotoformans]|uniref:Replication protein RepL n=1 Tax=Cereibacter azotoformans TaxID=43057 RepID=A0A2T5JIN8_9RHOB|nr:helix-turn-helix domain-containing protein [Cereibacter azotoformans]PTR05927.1 replication protein RepL [Cereibacter azotoformans]
MQAPIDMEEERKNRDFVQVYPKGWRRLRWLIQTNPTAAKLYSWIAEHMDPDGGALVVSQVVMAEALGVSEITVRRLTKWLEENHVMVRVRVGSGVYAYALDPEEVWRAWDTTKEHAVFRTKTLVKKKDRHNAQVVRRIRMMMKEAAGEPELPGLDCDPETGEIKE